MKNKSVKPAKNIAAKPQAEVRKKTSGPAADPGKKSYTDLLICAILALVTFLFYRSSLSNRFTNWDDPGYVINNPFLKNGLADIFSNNVMGNYHPLTILTLSVDYKLGGLDPHIYHIHSLILHILNVILAYIFGRMLFRSSLPGLLVAAIFAWHPMHVESVSWIAGRKDVLYGFYFLLSCICYLKYARSSKNIFSTYYLLAFITFILSVLSKPVAVSLPLVLILIDYLEGRKFDKKVIIEKVPFFAVSLIFGIISIQAQKEFGALATQDVSYNFIERILLGSYALLTYIAKYFFPTGLSNFYPYPLKANGALPSYFYIFPLVVAALVFVAWRWLRPHRYVIFGLLFFLVNIALLLQFIPVGGAILADRYTYMPYLGLSIALASVVAWYTGRPARKNTSYAMLSVGLVFALVLGVVTNNRSKDWYNTISLWKSEISVHPDDVPSAYNNLGFEYLTLSKEAKDQATYQRYIDSAATLLNKAISMKPDYLTYVSLGELERNKGNQAAAAKHYDDAIKMDPAKADAYLGKAISYCMGGHVDSCGFYFRKSVELKPFSPETHNGYGNYFDMTGKPDSALAHYNIAISQNPDMADSYVNRGRLYLKLGKAPEAVNDFTKYIALKPEGAETYFLRSQAYLRIEGHKADALNDAHKAMSLGYKIDPNYLNTIR